MVVWGWLFFSFACDSDFFVCFCLLSVISVCGLYYSGVCHAASCLFCISLSVLMDFVVVEMQSPWLHILGSLGTTYLWFVTAWEASSQQSRILTVTVTGGDLVGHCILSTAC